MLNGKFCNEAGLSMNNFGTLVASQMTGFDYRTRWRWLADSFKGGYYHARLLNDLGGSHGLPGILSVADTSLADRQCPGSYSIKCLVSR